MSEGEPDVHALIERGRAFDASYGRGQSNHLPMVLWALHRLGAGAQAMADLWPHLTRRLKPAPASQPWPAGDAWQGRLGDPGAWPAYRDLFEQWLTHEDAGDVLRQVLPVLMRGCGGAAFHGLIRTAYAVQSAHRGELADALAAWASRWVDLGAPPASDGTEPDPEVLLRRLKMHDGRDAPLIVDAMQAAAAQPGFDAVVRRLTVDAQTLPRLARAAAMAYAASGDFVVLHLVTSAHAVRVLWPWLEDDADAARTALWSYWRAFAAAVSAAGIVPRPALPLREWPDIVAAAIASRDDHVIKLVDSCIEQEAAYGASHWRAAATRAVAAYDLPLAVAAFDLSAPLERGQPADRERQPIAPYRKRAK